MKALRVLLMEDDTLIGLLLAEMLEEMGHEVCAVEATETAAVAAALRCRPQLLIVDVRLRDGSGVSAVDRILRTGPVPYILMSGDISRVRALRPGSVVLQKPFREPDFVRAIQRALNAPAVA